MDNLYLFPSFRYYRFPHLTVDRMYRRHCVKHDWTRTIHSPFIPSSEHSRQWQSVIRGVRSTYRASVSKRSRLGCFARLAAMLCPCVPLVTVPLIVVKYHARSCSKITRRYVKSISVSICWHLLQPFYFDVLLSFASPANILSRSLLYVFCRAIWVRACAFINTLIF